MTPPAPDTQVPARREPSFYKPLLAFSVVSLIIALTGFYFFQQIEGLAEKDKLHDLGTIADMKVGQIVSWHNNHQRLGEAFSRDSVLAVELGQWLQEGMPPNERMQRLRKILAELQRVNVYKTLSLLDRQGVVRLFAGTSPDFGTEHTQQVLQAMNNRQVVFLDFHRNSYGDKGISIDLIAPLTVAGKNHSRVVGAVVLQIDPNQFLYPLINSWPTPSASAETLLVRQEGSDVLFLNDLRHQKDTALSLRIPLATPKLPAAMAVRGEVESVDGIDYRGTQVVSEMRRVPDTPWFVVSKVDRDELFAPITRLKQWSAALGIIYAAIGGMLVFVWLRGHKVQYKYLQMQHAAAIERELLMKHFEYLTRYANDIILVSDETGHIVEANERALEAYGYTREELLRMNVVDFRDPAEDTAVFKGQIKQFMAAGELRYEATEQRKDGTTFPVEVSARLVEVEGVKYVQGIIRDISERKRTEELIRRNNHLLEVVFSSIHVMIAYLDRDFNFVKVNKAYAATDQRTPEFFSGKNHFDLFPNEENEAIFRKAVETGETIIYYAKPFEFAEHPERGVTYWDWRLEPIKGPDGRVEGLLFSLLNVTEQQLAQNALRKSSAEIEDLYNHAPCGYHSLDKDGVIVKINDTALHWLGYTREELINKVVVADLLSEDSRKVFQSRYPEFKERGVVHDIEYEFLRKDGTLLPVSLSSTAIYDLNGNYLACRSSTFDIANRRLAEKKLGESEKRFRTMADSAPIMIWMADVQDQQCCLGCNYFNRRWYEFTGLPFEKTHSCNWQALIHPDDKKHCMDAYRDAFLNKQPFRTEYRLRSHDGIFCWIEDSGVPRFTEDGDYLGFIGTCVDVTEQKLFEIIRVEMEHVDRLNIAGEMTSGLAHELSQPLTAANTYLDVCLRRMAENSWDHAALQNTVMRAHDQTKRAGQIISHLKDMVRKQKQERTLLDINSVVTDSIKFLEYELHQSLVSVTLDTSTLPLPLAPVNKIEIEQVLINLIKNAIDSMRSTPRRELHIVTRVLESGSILVKISDTGTGLAEEDMERIFNPFHTSKKDGLGLGLAICRSLIESYGGKIWAEKKEDEGAEFNFTLMTEQLDE